MTLNQSALLELGEALKAADGGEMMRMRLGFMVQALVDAEASERIGAARFERSPSRTTSPRDTASKRHCDAGRMLRSAIVVLSSSVQSVGIRGTRVSCWRERGRPHRRSAAGSRRSRRPSLDRAGPSTSLRRPRPPGWPGTRPGSPGRLRVGTNRTSPNGAASALIAAAPPEVPAGKYLTVVTPSSSAAMTSVAVTAPGRASTPCSPQRSTTAAERPGETTNWAPAATAWSTCATVSTVPAPTRMSPRAAIARIESCAAAVRKVTSATRRPPATSAPANPSASAASSSTTTGTRREPLRAARTFLGGSVH